DRGLKLFDVDLDGDLDLLHHDGEITRLHRNADGVLDAGTVINEDTTQETFGNGLNVCDVNGDGFEDVIVAFNVSGPGAGVPKLFVNVAGTLKPSAVQRGTPSDPDSLIGRNGHSACGDIDADGMADVLVRWKGTYRLLRGANTLTNRFRLRIVGAGGERNQQGRIVRVVPQEAPNRIITRVIESGSGLRSQSQYDLLIGAPWPGTYFVTVGFAAGDVATTAVAGDLLTIFADGRVENDREDDEE
ncbi:MAG: FG-GAP repeat domain-containing protein, partial [Woeseiaceae bacterium]